MVGKERCKECNSTQTRYRFKTDDYVCYSCGNVWKSGKEEKE